MGTKLWILLAAVSSMASLSSTIDLSSLMINPLGAAKTTTTTESPEYNTGNNYGHNQHMKPNKQHHFNKPDALIKQDHFQKLPQFELKDELKKFDNKNQFDINKHHNKVNKTNNQFLNQNQYGQQGQYNVIKVAHPVENPIYSTYTPNISAPVIDDGSYNQGYNQGPNQGYAGGGSQYTTPQNTYSQFRGYGAPSNGQTYGNAHNLTAYNVYRESYGYNDARHQSQSRPNYRPQQQQVIRPPPPQIRPHYEQPPNNYRPPTNQYSNPYQGNAQVYSEPGYSQPSYGSSNYVGESYGGYGEGPSYASPPQSQVYAPSYGVSAPVYDQGYHGDHGYRQPDHGDHGYHQPDHRDHGYHQPEHGYGHEDHSYSNSYNPNFSPYSPAPIDYSKYVSPMPYSELSEYISPAQYNEYTGMLYQAYNVPSPAANQRTYANQYHPSNYSSNKYKQDFQMVVAVVVIDGRHGHTSDNYVGGYAKKDLGAGFGGKDVAKDTGFGGKDVFDNKFDKKGDDYGKEYGYQGSVQGTLFISEIYPYVCLVSGVITGLPSNGKFGIAIYSFGDLTNGCLSIGDHYNPTHKNHGNINQVQSHVGDLGNINGDEKGVAFVNKISRNQFSILNRNPVAGRAIGICEQQDDLGQGGSVLSLKSGSCVNVQACGIIGLANTVSPYSNSGHH